MPRLFLTLLALLTINVCCDRLVRAELSVDSSLAETWECTPLELLEAAEAANVLHLGPDQKVPLAKHVSRIQREVRAQVTSKQSVRQQAAAIHRFLRTQILHGTFNEWQTRVDVALEDGSFNCVSASLWYVCLARSCGLDAKVVAIKSHVRVRVFDDTVFDVETTVPTGQDCLVDTDLSMARVLTDSEALGKVYYNLGVCLCREQNYAAGIEKFSRSLQLDPADAAAQQNRLAALNNWALDECARKQFSVAVQLVEKGLRLDSEHSPLLANHRYVYRRWYEHELAQGNATGAEVIRQRASRVGLQITSSPGQ